ncbi:MAG: penicillin-binding protein 2 [Clostridia bacterium]|nr:penicillin-binding protein 2 [Clostridia bacterium]
MFSYKKRITAVFLCLLMLMAVCSVRIATIATDEKLSEVAIGQSTRTVTVTSTRGTIYDCFGLPLTNAATEPVTVIFPSEQGAVVLSEMCEGEELLEKRELLMQGSPIIIKGTSPQSLGAITLQVPKRYSGALSHVIGYTDGTNHGVSGLEKGLDNILFNQKGITVSYKTDSLGRMLQGEGYEVDMNKTADSIKLTIDFEIQQIVEAATESVGRGAAVVVEAESGKIKAMVSRPDFDQNDISQSLSDEQSPLINRALYTYNVGSVFKPTVAAAALSTENENYVYNCKGSIFSGGLTFKCHKLSGHGEMDMKTALAESCNTYFYTLSQKIGAESLLSQAEAFRFGTSLDLGGGINTVKGTLPDLNTLSNSSAALINFSIGQGEIMLSPVAMSMLYSAIVSGGVYRMPTVIEGITQNGEYKQNEAFLPTRAMSKVTADALKKYLKNALQNGTGSEAFIDGISAGGKTGTAQTGWKDGNRSILNGWFCGFVETEITEYVVIILKEDVKSGSYDCAPIFKNISQYIFELDVKRIRE